MQIMHQIPTAVNGIINIILLGQAITKKIYSGFIQLYGKTVNGKQEDTMHLASKGCT